LGYDRFEDFVDDGWEDSFVVVGSEFSVAISQRALERSESCERSTATEASRRERGEGDVINRAKGAVLQAHQRSEAKLWVAQACGCDDKMDRGGGRGRGR